MHSLIIPADNNESELVRSSGPCIWKKFFSLLIFGIDQI